MKLEIREIVLSCEKGNKAEMSSRKNRVKNLNLNSKMNFEFQR